MAKPKKGDRLVYTGGYASLDDQRSLGILNPTPVPPYPPGTVVAFRNNRFHGPCVTVLLDKAEGDTEDLYADWPIHETKETP